MSLPNTGLDILKRVIETVRLFLNHTSPEATQLRPREIFLACDFSTGKVRSSEWAPNFASFARCCQRCPHLSHHSKYWIVSPEDMNCLSFSLKSNCTFKPSTQSLFLLDFLTSELQILVLLVVHKDAADHMSLLVHLAWKKLSLSLDETWTMVSLKAGTAEKLAEPLVTAFPGRMSLHHHLSGHLSVFHHHSTNPIQ